jgi:hypothetical protein
MVMNKTRAELRHDLDVQNREAAMKFVEGLLDTIYEVAKEAGVAMIDGQSRDDWYDEQTFILRGCQRPSAVLTSLASAAKSDGFLSHCLDAMKAAATQ